MKNNFFYLVAATLLFICTSCKKISESLQRDVILTEDVIFEIPIMTNITDQFSKIGIPTTLNLNDQLNANGFEIKNITATKIKSLDMAISLISTTPKDSIDAANNFANLATAKVEIASGDGSTSIAGTTITSTTTSGFLSFTTGIPPETLQPYLTKSTWTYNVIVKAKKITTTPLKVKATFVYTITVAK